MNADQITTHWDARSQTTARLEQFGTDDVRFILAAWEDVEQVEAIVRTIAKAHPGRRTYVVIGPTPWMDPPDLADVIARARRHAFMLVLAGGVGVRGGIRGTQLPRERGVLFEADLAHAVTATTQWLRRGDALVVLCATPSTLATARRALALGECWRAALDAVEHGDLSSVPSLSLLEEAIVEVAI